MKAFLVVFLLALAVVPLAAAAAPAQQTTPFDRTRVITASSETCPFDIQVHSTGTIHVWTFDDGRELTILQNFPPERPRPLRSSGLRSSRLTATSSSTATTAA